MAVFLLSPVLVFDTSNWFRLLVLPVLWMYLFCHDKSIFGGNGFHAIYPGSFLALVFLSHSSHCDQSSCFGFHQELFELLNCSLFAMLLAFGRCAFGCGTVSCSELSPGQRTPSLTSWGRSVSDRPAVLSFLPSYFLSTFHTTVSTSAYPLAFPKAFASWTIAP